MHGAHFYLYAPKNTFFGQKFIKHLVISKKKRTFANRKFDFLIAHFNITTLL